MLNQQFSSRGSLQKWLSVLSKGLKQERMGIPLVPVVVVVLFVKLASASEHR
jgi:hypothetical protein